MENTTFPTTRRVTITLAALARAFRLEYTRAALSSMSLTFFVCARSWRDLLALPVLEAYVAVGLFVLGGLGLNSIVDRHIDARYASDKRHVAAAVGCIGVGRMMAIVLGLTIAALALAAHVAVQIGSMVAFVSFSAAVVLGYGYSLPPLQFKLRGFVPHWMSLAYSTMFVPLAFSAYSYLGHLPVALIPFILGFTLVQYAMELPNQVLDSIEDAREGLATPAVRLGIRPALGIAWSMLAIGMCTVAAGLGALLYVRAAGAPSEPSWFAVVATAGATALPVWLGCRTPLRGIAGLLRACRGREPRSCVPTLSRMCDLPRWQARTSSGIALGSAVFYFVTTWCW